MSGTNSQSASVEQERPQRRPGSLRRSLLALLAVLAVLLTTAGVAWWQQRDLRDLDSLERAEATVTGSDYRRRRPDLVEVRYRTADGRSVQAAIPGGDDYRVGDRTEVAYVPEDPQRVRLVDGWAPPYQTWLTYAAALVFASPLILLRVRMRRGAADLGRALRRRRGR